MGIRRISSARYRVLLRYIEGDEIKYDARDKKLVKIFTDENLHVSRCSWVHLSAMESLVSALKLEQYSLADSFNVVFVSFQQ